MSFRIRSLLQVDADLEVAFEWYEAEHTGLGFEFLDEVRAAYRRIEENPFKYQSLRLDIRRALTEKFP
jgi:hypothetical protein